MWQCKNCKRTNGDAFNACHCGVAKPEVKAEPKPESKPDPKADK